MDTNYQEASNNQESAPVETTSASVSRKSKLRNRVRRFKPSRKYAGLIGFVLVIVVIGGGAFIYRNQNSSSSPVGILGEQEQKSEEEIQKENEELVEKVGELTLIPVGETPEVAEIADTTKLDSQAFFSRAQNGDKVLIYRTAKRVVLYRPSTNQVIETGPLVEPTSAPTVAPETPEEVQ